MSAATNPFQASPAAVAASSASPIEVVPAPKLTRNLASGKPALVLVSCGSFSPIHMQHLRNFEDARNSLSAQFDVIQGILSPVHDGYGKAGLAPAAHRVAMCEAATSDSDWLTVSRWETRQSAWSRTCDTVRAHHAAVNARAGWPQPPVQVRLLVGSDMLQSFDVPNLWQAEHMRALLADFGLVVIPRPGVDLDALMARSDTIRPHAANVLVAHEACGYPVSSTIVRQLLLSGQSPRYLVHDRVLDYCLKHGLWAPPAPVPTSAAQTDEAGDAKVHGH